MSCLVKCLYPKNLLFQLSAPLNMQTSNHSRRNGLKASIPKSMLNSCGDSKATGSVLCHIPPPAQSSAIYIVGVTFSFAYQNRTVFRSVRIERNHKNSPWVQAGIKGIAKMPNQQSNLCLLHSQLELSTILLLFQRKLLPQIQLHPAQLRNKAINRNNTLSAKSSKHRRIEKTIHTSSIQRNKSGSSLLFVQI